MNDFSLELKICEGCGVLWLRSGRIDGVYCRGCSARLAEFPPPTPVRRGNRRSLPATRPQTRPQTRRRPCRQPDHAPQPTELRPAGGAA